MAFITKSDLETLIYGENIDVITQGDDTIVTKAITAAIQQAEGYLGRYNTTIIFASQGEERETYRILITHITNLARWYLMQLSNASIDYEKALEGYNASLKELKIIEGKVIKGWPLAGSSYKSNFRFGSNKKVFTEKL